MSSHTDTVPVDTGSGGAKAAIGVSIIGIALVVVFFFTLSGQMEKLATASAERESTIAALSEQVSAQSAQMAGVEDTLGALTERMVALEKLPEKTRRMLLSGDLDGLAARLEVYNGQLDEESAAKLAEAKRLIGEASAAIVSE